MADRDPREVNVIEGDPDDDRVCLDEKDADGVSVVDRDPRFDCDDDPDRLGVSVPFGLAEQDRDTMLDLELEAVVEGDRDMLPDVDSDLELPDDLEALAELLCTPVMLADPV